MKLKKSLKDNAFDSSNLEIGSRLYENTPVFYHWSNCASGTKYIQQMSKGDEKLIETIDKVWMKLEQLKQILIWLKTSEHIIPMNMYDVYATVMGHIRKNNQEDNLMNSQQISFIGPSGPYKDISLIELINKNLYQDFVYYYLIKNRLPLRSFRLFVNGSIVIQFGNAYQFSTKIEVKQLTENGVLFASKDDELLQKIELGEKLKFIILGQNLTDIKRGVVSAIDQDKQDLFFTTDSMQYFLVDTNKVTKALSFDSGISGEFYLFCRYVDMMESDFPELVKDFLEYSKDKVFKESA